MWLLKVWFAGIWPLLFTYGIGVFAIGCALVFAWFSPVLKKTALWVAGAIGVGLVCYSLGVAHEHDRMQAQLAASEQRAFEQGKAARTDADSAVHDATPDQLRDDRYNRDNH